MGSTSLSYAELESTSNRLARWLREAGCERGDRVCLLAQKSPAAVAGILGILKAGCAYVPLDGGAPPARLATVVSNADPAAILADAASIPLLSESLASPEGSSVPIAWLDPTSEHGIHAWMSADDDRLPPVGDPSDKAYIMFTSGSTGVPKGVVITHRNVSAFVRWAVSRFRLDRSDRNSGHPPLFFDLSVFDLFGTFAAGAQLHLIPADSILAPHSLLELIASARLTQWFSVPSTMTYLARYGDMDAVDLSALKRVLWCGDVLPTATLVHWMDRLPGAEFTNLYGPTETTIASSWYTVPSRPRDERERIPIGHPCEGEEFHVLDDRLQPVPLGTVGDLYISGVGLSPGYWRDPDRTAEVFGPPPRTSDIDGRIYRTGDLASLSDEGLFHFHGRNDSQIKSRGYRIELNEIERAVDALGLVSSCAVVGAATVGFERTTICCAYVPMPGSEDLHPRRLRTALLPAVPSYMLPSRWKVYETLPTTANGKIDRNAVRRAFESEDPHRGPD